MYHIFFIHLSVDGHFSCFHDLAIINNAAMNIGVHVSFFFFFINLFILFIFGCVGSLPQCTGSLQLRRAGATLLRCGARASHCGGLPCCRARAPGAWAPVAVARGLQSTGSAAVAHGLPCSVACGIFPDQGSNPHPLHWQADSQPLCHQGSPACVFLNYGFL